MITEAIDDAQDGVGSVRVTLSDLQSNGLSQNFRKDPLYHLRALQHAAMDVAKQIRPDFGKNGTLRIALEDKASPVSPRQLTSASLQKLITVEGVATKVSNRKPKVVKSVHYCPKTEQFTERDYVDETDPRLGLRVIDASGTELPERRIHMTSSVYPTQDADGNPLETEFGQCHFKDYQTIVLQEMPEKAPMGQLPRSVQLVLEHDLVDQIKPGDRVQVVGVYRALPGHGQASTPGVFRTAVLVNNVTIIGESTTGLVFGPNDVRQIKELATHENVLQVLANSVAPSIHGHDMIKRALILQLLAGVEKNLENGTHLRGDINILMVGDPSTAKSQLLRACMNIAPLAVSTTGKGSSGVGLTAAVTSDPDTGERRLEAGAMVLADRGIVCVDEFDKMGENDRVAIHEAMEQQTVTIAKAGIHASLNARCAVLAAANPVYGQYDRMRKIQENIGLPDSLLSRFDLLFVVLDQMDPTNDRNIAQHVLKGHCYRGVAEHDHEDDDDEEAERTNDSIWVDSRRQDTLQHDFLRKYLHYCKSRTSPTLTEASREWIANRYAQLRAAQDDRTLPITARSLETVIRLATAHCKARLSLHVEASDCQTAMDLLTFALYHERRDHKPPADVSFSEDPPQVEGESPTKRPLVSDDEQESPKRPRLTDIWEKLEADQIMAEEDIPKDILDTLIAEDRVQVSEGQVYPIS